MLRTLSFFLIVWLSLLLSLVLFLPFPLFLADRLKKTKRKYIWFWTHNWAKFAVFLSGSKISVEGRDEIPANLHFVILSNHQGLMDIPVLMTVFPYPLSFVAKKELLHVPLINLWLISLQCLTIDRKRPFRSHKKISERLDRENKNPLIIFPEGTRSRSPEEGVRKKGGIKLVENSGIPVIYVRINGTYKIWEEHGKIKPAKISVKISRSYEKMKE